MKHQQKLSILKLFIIATFSAVLVIVLGIKFLQPDFLFDFLGANQLEEHSVSESSFADSGMNVNHPQRNSSDKLNTQLNVSRLGEDSDTLLGHFRYRQADVSNLMLLGSYGVGQYQRFEFLEPVASKALMKMIYAARNEGIWIIPVSAFRSVELQSDLFERQVEKKGSSKAAAKLSAPPGYSEHHTGFAVDLTDGHFPEKDITLQFERSNAYTWLQNNAENYGFELSFPRNNSQGVSYEPWHWRFVGSETAKQVFLGAQPK